MKNYKLLFCSALLLLPILLLGQDLRYAPQNKGVLIENTYYCLDFNEEHKQPNWVYYMLTQSHFTGKAARSSTFKDCKQGGVESAKQSDYKGSGYDKGHLCPAADMTLSTEAMKETFQMWNVSPQVPAFNRGRWANLEALVRGYIKTESDTLFVVTGPVFISNQGTIGKSNVTVPSYFYKVVYSPTRGGIGFLMPNQRISSKLQSWQTSIELIEVLTGIDFFPQLPKEVQAKIESQVVWWD